MRNLSITLISLAALAFILAVIKVLVGLPLGITAEGFSRAATNLALLAVALMMWSKWHPQKAA